MDGKETNTIDDLLQLFVWLAKRQGVTEEELSKILNNHEMSMELAGFWNKACKISRDNEK